MGLNSFDVAIFTIGTELTTGQITNTNASWLAEQLTNLQYNVVCHLSVADDFDDIAAGLDYIVPKAKIIFVCGGLGPTTDDMTREAMARYWRKSQFFHQPSWDKIVQRITSSGFPLSETNRRQCWYPEGSTVLPNPNGTADAFSFSFGERDTYVLPGPPVELKGIWSMHLAEAFKARRDQTQGTVLKRWNILGISESVLGETVEAFTKETPDAASFVYGYRPHIPYVELKIWYPKQEEAKSQQALQTLRKTLQANIVYDDDHDIVGQLLELAKPMRTLIIEPQSHGWLSTRLNSIKTPNLRFPTLLSRGDVPMEADIANLSKNFDLILSLDNPKEGEWVATFQRGNERKKLNIAPPFNNTASQKLRIIRFALEKSFVWWVEELLKHITPKAPMS